jgi:hypothetical protein
VQEVLSKEQERDFRMPTFALSIGLFASVTSALVASGIILMIQLRFERGRIARETRSAKARRLRWLSNGEEVVIGPPHIPDNHPPPCVPTYEMGRVSAVFHIFLSHVWGTGQDQMRIVKQRLLEMMPDALVFLECISRNRSTGMVHSRASDTLSVHSWCASAALTISRREKVYSALVFCTTLVFCEDGTRISSRVCGGLAAHLHFGILLHVHAGAEYIDVCFTTLVFSSAGYYDSKSKVPERYRIAVLCSQSRCCAWQVRIACARFCALL